MIDVQERQSQPATAVAENDGVNLRLQLFRKQVLEPVSSYDDYNIILPHSSRSWIFFGFVATVTIALLCIIVFANISKKVRVTGIVVPSAGSVTVSSPITGPLTRIFITEGQLVKPGDPLFEVSADRNTADGSSIDALKQRIAARQGALTRESFAIKAEGQRRIDEILLKIAGAQRELSSLDEDREFTSKRLAIAQKRVDRVSNLNEKGFYSAAQLETEEERVLELKGGLNSLLRNRQTLLTNIASLKAEAEIAASNLRSELARVEGREASIDQESVELESRNLVRIVAVASGRATNIAYSIGQHIVSGQSLLAIMPDAAELDVHLYVPNRAIGRLAAGQQVSMRYHAFPFQQYGRHGGKIVELGRTPFAPSELPVSLSSTVLGNVQASRPQNAPPEGLYRVKVSINPPGEQSQGSALLLKPGMTLDADIIVGQVKLWQWMLEPFRVAY